MEPIDLYLGSDLGLWALKQTPPDCIKQVITEDDEISSEAQARNINVVPGNPNNVNFEFASSGLSVHYPKILGQSLISRYSKIYNIHPGFLPWGRGFYPVFWAMWEETPAGATIHEIVAKVDQGPIVDQIPVEYYPHDTGYTLFSRVRYAEKQLFSQYSMAIIECENLPTTPQPSGGTYHTKAEFFNIKSLENWHSIKTLELVKLIRCLSFPGYSGLEISLEGQKFSVSMEALPKNQNSQIG